MHPSSIADFASPTTTRELQIGPPPKIGLVVKTILNQLERPNGPDDGMATAKPDAANGPRGTKYHNGSRLEANMAGGPLTDPVPSCSPPLPGCYKLNIDASHVVVNAGLVGLGLMIRNEAGCVRLVASLNPQLAKAIAILHGICLAIDSGSIMVHHNKTEDTAS
ncbi:hypothetical protein ACOSQ2_023733 [Xanthoceras sorbifolium]